MKSKHASLEALKVLAVTWNVNARVEQKNEMKKLLKLDSYERLEYPDIVAVGLQEVVELSTTNVVGSAISGQCKDKVNKWQEMITECFHESSITVDMVASVNMVGLWLVVFVSHSIRSSISKVQSSSFARGVGGVLGNKGAVYVRMDILDTSLCFVNAHFAAHREQVQKRNKDFHAILSHKCFPDYLSTNVEQLFSNVVKAPQTLQLQQKLLDIRKKIAVLDSSRKKRISKSTDQLSSAVRQVGSNVNNKVDLLPRQSADDHDVVIWLGDLNYRIVPGIDTSVVYDMIESKRSIYLAPYDQLNQERDKGTVFSQFHEGLLTFEPTYKYIPGRDCYDNRKEKKLRCPAWCDRVLWRIGKHSATNNSNTNDLFSSDSDGGDSVEDNATTDYTSSVQRSTKTEGTMTGPETFPAEGGLGDSAMEVELNLDSELTSPFGAYAVSSSKTTTSKGIEKKQFDKLDSVDSGTANAIVSSSSFSEGEEEYDCEEVVELMMYDRGANTISDHKPVHAVLNMKVKRVDWAAFESMRIAAYHKQCLDLHQFTLKSCHYTNRLSMAAVTVRPSTIKLYSLLAPIGTESSDGATVNCSYFQLTNNLAACDIEFSFVETSVPSWLVLSVQSGVIEALSSARLQVTTKQDEIDSSAMMRRERIAQFHDLPVLGKYLLSSGGAGGNYTDQSVELYAMLEVRLTALKWDGGDSMNLKRGDDSTADGISSNSTVAQPERVTIETILIPIVCSAEHNAKLL